MVSLSSSRIHRWIAEEWSSCSKTCGNGMRERAVACSEESNGIKHKVSFVYFFFIFPHSHSDIWVFYVKWSLFRPYVRLSDNYVILLLLSLTHTHFFCLANMLCGAQIPDDMCRSTKPVTSEPCNIQDCPKWVAREWSGVSIYKMYFFLFVSYKYCSPENVYNSPRSQVVHMYVNI